MFEILFAGRPAPEDLAFLTQKLDEHAMQFAEIPPAEKFLFKVMDAQNQPVAGCTGNIFYGGLFLNLLWVDEKLRGQKYGTRLVQAAENLARDRNCKMICIRTMSWQALDFYKKLGYVVELAQGGFIYNSTMYHLRKDLVTA